MSPHSDHSILIVEDELLIAEHISRVLHAAGYSKTFVAINVEEAIDLIQTQKPDIILTDIALGSSKTGIDLGHLLYTHYKIPFVYITSHSSDDVLQKARHTFPNAYLVKPFKKEDLLIAIDLALFNSKLSAKNAEEYLTIKDGHAIAQLQFDAIVWMEADGNYTTIYTTNNKKRLVRQVITDLHHQLPVQDFVRIHRSYVINKTHVTEYKSSMVHLGDIKLPVGRTYKDTLDSLFK